MTVPDDVVKALAAAVNMLSGAVWEQLEEIRSLIVTEQQDIDAQTAAIAAVSQQLATATTAIQQEIAALQAGGVNTTGLDAAVQQLQAASAAVAAIPPAASSPPAAPPVG